MSLTDSLRSVVDLGVSMRLKYGFLLQVPTTRIRSFPDLTPIAELY